MANTGFKGVDVRQTGSQLVFRVSLKDSSGVRLTTGTTTLYLYELQSDGTLKSYDFNDNSFKTGTLTTETATMTHRSGNNGATTTGIWTYALSTLTGFTVGGIYFAAVRNSGATPAQQEREFQYGGDQGDLVVTANGTGVGELNTDVKMIKGTTSAGAAGYVGLDWGNVNAPTTTVVLSGTTIGTLTTYTDNTPQTGDAYALIGETGSGLTSLAPASTALSTAEWTNSRAAKLDNLDAAVSSVSSGVVGSGADNVTLTFTADSNPIADADVWVTVDSEGENVVAGTLQTNSLGQATFLLDAGLPYYAWLQKDGVNPIRGELFTAVAD